MKVLYAILTLPFIVSLFLTLNQENVASIVILSHPIHIDTSPRNESVIIWQPSHQICIG